MPSYISYYSLYLIGEAVGLHMVCLIVEICSRLAANDTICSLTLVTPRETPLLHLTIYTIYVSISYYE